MLRSDSVLQKLSDDQMSRVVELSKNDEDVTMKKRIGDLHGRYDDDFKSVLGISKPSGVKSYVFWKDEIKKLKDQNGSSTELQKEVENLKSEKSELEKKIKDGSTDETLKAAVTKLEDAIKNSKSTITQLRNDAKVSGEDALKKLNAEIARNSEIRVNGVFSDAMAKVKFKAGIPDFSITATIDAAKRIILAKGDVIFNDDGTTVIKGSDDIIITNKNNLHKPYLLGEQLMDELDQIIDSGKKGAGAGSGKNSGGGGTFVLDSITKVDAVDQIDVHLASLGLVKGTEKYMEEQMKMYHENKISSLPSK